MASTSYERGRAAEYKTQADLEKIGFVTLRTSGSHGAMDVLAWNADLLRFIQVKTYLNKRASYAKDVRELEDMIVPPNSTKELWVRKIGQRGWETQLLVGTTGVLIPTSLTRKE